MDKVRGRGTEVATEPVYISETVERTMNPMFRHVDFASCGPGITRLEQVTVRVWVHGARMERWRQLLEVEVDLRTMQYLGKSVRCRFLSIHVIWGEC